MMLRMDYSVRPPPQPSIDDIQLLKKEFPQYVPFITHNIPGMVSDTSPSYVPPELQQYWNADKPLSSSSKSRLFPPNSITEFTVEDKIGHGTFGQVFKARTIASPDDPIVALKQIRREDAGYGITTLREIQLLSRLNHKNIVKLHRVVSANRHCETHLPMAFDFHEPPTWEGFIALVFEYIPYDLEKLRTVGYLPSPDTIQYFIYQLLQALHFCHINGIIHRDIKCANILINEHGDIKLADFGLARPLPSRDLTPEVITLYYRAPEVLLYGPHQQAAMEAGPNIRPHYDFKVDMWAVGCVMAQLMTGKVLFNGQTEIAQANQIFALCGIPTVETWPQLQDLPLFSHMMKNNQLKPTAEGKTNTLTTYILQQIHDYTSQHPVLQSFASNDQVAFEWSMGQGVHLIHQLMQINPTKRLSAVEALNHPYFTHSPVPLLTQELFSSKYTAGLIHRFTAYAAKQQQLQQQQQAIHRRQIPGVSTGPSQLGTVVSTKQNVFPLSGKGVHHAQQSGAQPNNIRERNRQYGSVPPQAASGTSSSNKKNDEPVELDYGF